MDREEAIELIQEVMKIVKTQHMCKDIDGECTEEDRKTYIQRFEALRMAVEVMQEPERKWIPITYHEPIEEDGEDTRYGYILDCQMPDEGQEVLVSFNDMVYKDKCCYDSDGWYLDDSGGWLDVDAWMPLPEPYKAGEQE